MPDKENFNCVLQPVVYNGATVTSPANYQSQKQGDACPTISTDTRNLLVEPVYAGKLGYIARFGNKLEEDKTPCLETSLGDNTMSIVKPVIAVDMGGGKTSVDLHFDRSPTLTCTHYGEPAVVYDARSNGDGKISPTITGDHQNRITDYTGIVIMDRGAYNQGINAKYDIQFYERGISFTETARGPCAVAYAETIALEGNGSRPSHKGDGYAVTDKGYSLNTAEVHGVCYESKEPVGIRYIVRRLTPLECERLQGYPDGWTDIGEYTDSKGKKVTVSDSARYKALGNSIALPSWKWVLKRLCGCYERPATMASLFDGIGGFPLIWEQFNGKGTCLWASEIEEFPIAVTKERIG